MSPRKRVVQLGLIEDDEPGEALAVTLAVVPAVELIIAPREVIVRPGTVRPVWTRVHGPIEFGDTLAGRVARYPALAALIDYGGQRQAPGYFIEPTLEVVEAQRRQRAAMEARTARGVDPGRYLCLCLGEEGTGYCGSPAPRYAFRRTGETCETCGYTGYNPILFRQIAVAPTKALWPGGIMQHGGT